MNCTKPFLNLVVWVSPRGDERICLEAQSDGFIFSREFYCAESANWSIYSDFDFDPEQLDPLIETLSEFKRTQQLTRRNTAGKNNA